MQNPTKYLIIAGAFILYTTALIAQPGSATVRDYDAVRTAEDFTDDDIKRFGQTLKAVEEFQKSSKVELEAALEAEGLTMDSFNDLAQRMKNSDKDSRPSQEERAKFIKINEVMHENQRSVGTQVVRTIEQNGMEVQDYQDKLRIYQEDEAFRKKVQAAMK